MYIHLFNSCVHFRSFNIKVSTAICDVQNASRPSHLPALSAANVACTLGRLMKDKLEPMGRRREAVVTYV